VSAATVETVLSSSSLVAAGTAKHLKSLLPFWSGSHLTDPTISLVGKMLANHPASESSEMKVASNVSLVPLALGLHNNESLACLTVSVDNLQPHNPTTNDDNIRCFLHLLQVKKCTLKHLKVTNESWHGNHLWKPQCAQNSATCSRSEKIQNLLQQNGKGRVLPGPVSAPENNGSAPRLPPEAPRWSLTEKTMSLMLKAMLATATAKPLKQKTALHC